MALCGIAAADVALLGGDEKLDASHMIRGPLAKIMEGLLEKSKRCRRYLVGYALGFRDFLHGIVSIQRSLSACGLAENDRSMLASSSTTHVDGHSMKASRVEQVLAVKAYCFLLD